MTLFPTKARLRTLRAVADGGVIRHEDGSDYDVTAGWIRVGGRVQEMSLAGWVRLDEAAQAWRVTEAGAEILAKHPKTTVEGES